MNIAVAHPLPVPLTQRYVSEEEYWEKYYEGEENYEWNNGYLEEKPVSDWQTVLVYKWFNTLLLHFLRVNPIAETSYLDFGFRLALPHKVAIRKPDLAVFLKDNPAAHMPPEQRTFKGIFDMCVEALSDSTPAEARRDTQTKRQEYEIGGVREYYILHPSAAYQAFYYRDAAGLYQPLPAADGIIRSRVLSGFQFRIADLNRQPDEATMMRDEVYQAFVNPELQAALAEIERLKRLLAAQ